MGLEAYLAYSLSFSYASCLPFQTDLCTEKPWAQPLSTSHLDPRLIIQEDLIGVENLGSGITSGLNKDLQCFFHSWDATVLPTTKTIFPPYTVSSPVNQIGVLSIPWIHLFWVSPHTHTYQLFTVLSAVELLHPSRGNLMESQRLQTGPCAWTLATY